MQLMPETMGRILNGVLIRCIRGGIESWCDVRCRVHLVVGNLI